MNCEKCKTGTMYEAKIPRFSGCLIAIGYSLLVPAILALLLTTGFALFGMFATGQASVEGVGEAKERALESLRAIEGLPGPVITDFYEDGQIEDSNKDSLPPEQRRRVDSILGLYNASVAGTAIGSTMAAGLGAAMVFTVYAVAVPALVVGFVLLLKKNVWMCRRCRYVFDRA